MNGLKVLVLSRNTTMALFFLIAILVTTQSLLKDYKTHDSIKKTYTQYNNYIIFKQSFEHLKHHQDLYQLYPEEHHDLYKYSPTFSLCFAPFAILPDWLGLTLWNLLNVMLLCFAVYQLPGGSEKQKGYMLLMVVIELITSIQNSQSNALMSGLLILMFSCLEQKRDILATFCLVFSVFIKLFSGLGILIFLFYPNTIRLLIYSLLWTILLFFIPLILVDFEYLLSAYKSWTILLAMDHDGSYGFSIMGWLYTWFGYTAPKIGLVIFGFLMLLTPFIKIGLYKNLKFRMLTLSSILIWIVIFNHKAESPTFIIAVMGIVIWFMHSVKSFVNITLLILVFVFTILSPTDLFPRFIRHDYFVPYVVKVFPCILVWLKVLWDMILMDKTIRLNDKS